MPDICENIFNSTWKKYLNKNFYLSFDETTDSSQRQILNVLIRKLDSDKPSEPDLLFSGEIHVTNSEVIHDVILKLLKNVIKGGFMKNYFRLLVTDGASYCDKVGKMLKLTFPNLYYIKCICHNIHNICEELVLKNNSANDLVCKLKNL